jgi:hypothetical protein
MSRCGGMLGRQSGFGDFRETIARLVFEFGVFGERDANRVTESIREQGPNPNRGLHATVFSFSRFRDTQMQGVVPFQAVLFRRQQTVRLDHDQGVARFHTKDEIVVVEAAADIRKFNGRFDHTAGCVSIKGQDAGRKRTVVGTDAHAAIERLAFLHQRLQGFDQVGAFRKVIFFCFVNLFFKIFTAVSKVPWVDANLLHGVGDEQGNDGLKVHIGTEGNVVSLLKETFSNLGTRVRFALSLYSDTDQVESLVGTAHDLLNGRIDVRRVGRGHGLSDNRMLRTKIDGTASDRTCRAADHLGQIFAVLFNRSVDFLTFARPNRRRPLDVGYRSRLRSTVECTTE